MGSTAPDSPVTMSTNHAVSTTHVLKEEAHHRISSVFNFKYKPLPGTAERQIENDFKRDDIVRELPLEMIGK